MSGRRSIPDLELRSLGGPARKATSAKDAVEAAARAQQQKRERIERELTEARRKELEEFYAAPRCQCGAVVALHDVGSCSAFECGSCRRYGFCFDGGTLFRRVYEYLGAA